MNKIIFSFVVSACFFTGTNSVNAQDILLTASIGVDTFYDDQFDTQIDDTETGSIVYRPLIEMSYTGQRYRSTLRFGATYNEFIDSEFDNSSNFSAGWDFARDAPNNTLGLSLNYDQRLVAELLELDDGLNISSNEVIETLRITPSYAVNISQLSRLEFSYSYIETNRENITQPNIVDNSAHEVSAIWERTLSQRSTLGVYGNFQAYRPDLQDDTQLEQFADADIYGLAVGGAFQLSERWSADGNMGLNQTQIDRSAQATTIDGSGIVGDGDITFSGVLDLRYAGLRNTFGLGLNAGTNQQLDGAVDNQQSLSINWDRQLGERSSSTISSRYFQADRNDRTGLDIQASLNWQPSTQWQYSLSYRYRRQDNNIDQALGLSEISGVSNRITLTVEYAFDDLRFDI